MNMDLSTIIKICLQNKIILPALTALILVATFFFDSGLSIALGLLVILSSTTVIILKKFGFKDRNMYILLALVLAIHLGATLFMHYTDFQPFSDHVGDYLTYQRGAVALSHRFLQGNFSIKDFNFGYPELYVLHYYPVILGVIYALTAPAEIIGLILNVWLVAVTMVFLYLIILDIGGSKASALIVGLVSSVYPSYVFNTGLLLKEAMEIFFVMLALMLIIKIIKKFTWYRFLFLYLAIAGSTHFRFYIGYSLIATFILSWVLFPKIHIKKRFVYCFVFILILGSVPQISAGEGYFGINSIKTFVNPKMVNVYRQLAFKPTVTPIMLMPGSAPGGSSVKPVPVVGLDSSFEVSNDFLGYIKSTTSVLLGPFPWQLKFSKQLFALIETFPWYVLLIFIITGIRASFKKRLWQAMPLLIFSVMVIGLLALFINNFGLLMRVRMPAFLALLCVSALSFDKLKYLNELNWFRKINT